jgi:hypothetical protein
MRPFMPQQMNSISKERRKFLKGAGLVGSFAMMPGSAAAAWAGEQPSRVVEDAFAPQQAEQPAIYHINFAVCGMSHDHIYRMVGAIQRGAANWYRHGWRSGQKRS